MKRRGFFGISENAALEAKVGKTVVMNLDRISWKFNSSPLKNGWLGDDPFLLGFGNFSGASC